MRGAAVTSMQDGAQSASILASLAPVPAEAAMPAPMMAPPGELPPETADAE